MGRITSHFKENQVCVRVSFPKSDYAKCISGISIEDVKNVSGISETVYSKIKEDITV